jgi:glycosyltransferase involved in cell wall biosynthesis
MAAPEAVTGPMTKLADLLAGGLRGEGCEVVTVPWGSRGGGTLLARVRERADDVRRIRRALAAERPDVLLVQTSHDWFCVARDLALARTVRGRVRKVVLQFHGSRADLLVAPGSTLFKWATTSLLRSTDGVLVLSSEERRALESFFPRGCFYLVTNPFLPTLAGAKRPGNGQRSELPTILFAARLLPEKGIFDTIEAFAILSLNTRANLVVAGAGPAADEVRERVVALGLSERVTLAGRLTPARMADAYEEADVFVLPTYHPEGFPTAISEAMSAGLPIVTSRVRGNADHLVEPTNAIFVPPRDPVFLAGALERLLADDPLRERMSRANREKVKEFAPERVAGDYVRALRDVLSR